MTQEKKLELLEDMLELDPGTLKPEMELSDVENWDSMAQLSLIVLIDDECDKRVSGNDIKKLVTVQDILDMMDN